MADQYIKLPDGSYGRFDASASDDYIRAQISKDFPNAYASPSPTDMANQALAASGIQGGAAGPAGSGITGATMQPVRGATALVTAGNIARGQAQSYAQGGGILSSGPGPGGIGVTDEKGETYPAVPQTFNPLNPIQTAGYLVPQPVKDIYNYAKAGMYGQAVETAAPYVASQTPGILKGPVTPGGGGGGYVVPGPQGTPHPQAASNLAAAADVGGKPAGVRAVYEDYAKPASDAFRDAAAREGVTKADFKGRNGYDTAIQVANRLQSDVNAQAQPYFDAVQNRPIMPSMRDRLQAQLGPIMDALPTKLSDAIQNANTVGDLNAIRMELNQGGGRYFNAATDMQFAAPESQQAMADAGNTLRNEVYNEIENVTGKDVRPIKQLEGNAINLRTQFEKAKPVLSKVADQAEAPPGYIQQLRSGKTGLEIAKGATGIQALQPPNALELFNTRMQRAIRGGDPSPISIPTMPSSPGIPTSRIFTGRGLPGDIWRGYEQPSPQYPQLPQGPGPYNFGQTPIQGQPFVPRPTPFQLERGPIPAPPSPVPPPAALPGLRTPYGELPPTSSVQVGGTPQRLSLREQLRAAAARRR